MILIDVTDKYEKRLPKVGDILPAFDDGKVRPSRLYPAKVLEVLPWGEETLNKKFKMIDFSKAEVEFKDLPLKFAWEFAYTEYDWVFSDKTDYFIITEGDCVEPIEIFAREKNGGWFSFPLISYMTGSLLDADMKLFNEWKGNEWCDKDYEKNKDKFKIID